MVIDFLNDLNDVQQQAVKEFEGPSLIVAGAGSGKTRVLTYRIAYLLQQQVPPHTILSLTFTNKAAGEMRERIAGLVGDKAAKSLWMGTFHSMFSRILRAEAESLGFPSSFTIYDAQDSKNLVKQIIKELQLDDEIYKPSDVFSRISSSKNSLITPSSYAQNPQVVQQDMAARKPMIGDIYRLYAARCIKAGAMDFDDLLFYTNILFRDHPEILNKYQQKFRYILVDEYQDTNYSQYLIVKKLSQLHHNVCVVGDDSQSIYAFRGAKIENILNFRKDYPSFKLFKLEQNYRSTKTIVNAANSLIEKNKNRIPKQVWSAKEDGAPVRLLVSQTDIQEGFAIAGSISELKRSENFGNDDFAILYRTNAQSRIMEESLRKMNIPYRVFGGLSFYQRKEVKDLLAYLRLLVNSNDDEAFKRVINYPQRGIGTTTVAHLSEAAGEHSVSLWETAKHSAEWAPGLNKGAQAKIKAFVDLIQGFMALVDSIDAYEVTFQVAQASGILAELKADRSPEGMTRGENIEEVLNGVREFVASGSGPEEEEPGKVTLTEYLQNVSLLTDADLQKEDDKDKVTLMTVHASKGLEFDVVYIAGLEENLFPSQMAISSVQDVEEERRLFYVGLTRARRFAFLSYATSRFRWGTSVFCSPSRFLKEIDPQFLEVPAEAQEDSMSDASFPTRPGSSFIPLHRASSQRKEVEPKQNGTVASLRKSTPSSLSDASFVADDPQKICLGMRVEHQRFGVGEVIQMEGTPPDAKATVLFKQAGTKQLLLKFARLRIV